MSTGPRFNLSFEPQYGEAVRIAPLVRRITVNNPGPFTFRGTNTYLVGDRALAIIDPGPIDGAHLDALLYAIGDAEVRAILVTHTHQDHSPAARRLALKTGAPIYGEGPHRPSRPLDLGELNPLDGSGDRSFQPDVRLADGDTIAGPDWSLTAIATPGHCANHLAFALDAEATLFSGDHVMAWSTTIVAPPDGAMADYMASLEKLMGRTDRRYFPGHGGPVEEVALFLAALHAHRLGREGAILDRLAAGDRDIPAMVEAIYTGLDPKLHPAAAFSVLAHLEYLVDRGLVATDGMPAINRQFRLA